MSDQKATDVLARAAGWRDCAHHACVPPSRLSSAWRPNGCRADVLFWPLFFLVFRVSLGDDLGSKSRSVPVAKRFLRLLKVSLGEQLFFLSVVAVHFFATDRDDGRMFREHPVPPACNVPRCPL